MWGGQGTLVSRLSAIGMVFNLVEVCCWTVDVRHPARAPCQLATVSPWEISTTPTSIALFALLGSGLWV